MLVAEEAGTPGVRDVLLIEGEAELTKLLTEKDELPKPEFRISIEGGNFVVFLHCCRVFVFLSTML